ncbi:AAA family ATPase [Bacillus thuringiensis]|uniref:DNA-binding protein n=1 Tax=Bacillus thuringiensis TaxID=1428 RepID=A0A9X6TK49_BACTU|nr:ATP-binding protein [Bacillus thuringiensis]PEA87720.1 DNA-binding protein [Bacillus thuringiensis]
MKHGFEIIKIIDASLKLDTNRVVGYARRLSDNLQEEGDDKSAQKIKKILSSNSVGAINANTSNAMKLPFDQESKFNLGEIIYPNDIKENAMLNSNVKQNLDKFIRYYKNIDLLISEGVEPPNTVLLYGPPGCGKTLLAKNLSKMLNIPIVIVRLDTLISSFLGSTAKNIRNIFEYAHNNPCILFFDEFDAVAKIRDDKQELGELKRVVNSLLQNIDLMDTGSILIAATNHENLLDSAVWRRFFLKLEITLPDTNTRKNIINDSLQGFTGYDDLLLSKLFTGLSGASIKNLCLSVKREALLHRTKEINIEGFLEFFFNGAFATDGIDNIVNISSDDLENRVKYIRGLDSKFFTYSILSQMFDVSNATISRLLNNKGE